MNMIQKIIKNRIHELKNKVIRAKADAKAAERSLSWRQGYLRELERELQSLTEELAKYDES